VFDIFKIFDDIITPTARFTMNSFDWWRVLYIIYILGKCQYISSLKIMPSAIYSNEWTIFHTYSNCRNNLFLVGYRRYYFIATYTEIVIILNWYSTYSIDTCYKKMLRCPLQKVWWNWMCYSPVLWFYNWPS